jgi:predicted HAD superfamily Cof-like phosphohydrolase
VFVRRRRARVDVLHEVPVLEHEHAGRGDSRGGRRARARVEERELAEQLARAEDGEEVLAAVGGAVADLHLAVDEDVQTVAGLALAEQDLAATQLDLTHDLQQGAAVGLLEILEQRHRVDDVTLHSASPSS